MTVKFFNKTISIFLALIMITGLFPPFLFSQPSPSSFKEVKGFNSSVFDNHFSRADREIDADRWLLEAEFGITQAICVWELTAEKLYDNPGELYEAKNQLKKWSDEELEKRFSQWLMGRFFGKASENAFIKLSSSFDEVQKNYSWHLDKEGNIIFDAQTGDPLVIRPNDEDREFSHDLILWRGETSDLIKTANKSYDNAALNIFPELLTYIPYELRESMGNVIKETINLQSISLKNEFENIAAREERIFSSRRTRDIWSLRNKSENEAARIFTNKLITETEDSCKKGMEELNAKIEQAAAGTDDLALLGEEWLRLYQEQFNRGLEAWENAEERFFIRRTEWEQDSALLFSQGDAAWIAAFEEFDKEKEKWELKAKELFDAGDKMFSGLSEDFEKSIAKAKEEFELSMKARLGEGKTKVKALIDMYILCSSTALSALENYNFWKKENNETETQKAYAMYSSYLGKASDVRQEILDNYASLFGTGALKDILSPNASSEDFYLDDYQLALIKAQALVLYWERKSKIAESVMTYAQELTAGRLTEAEGTLAWKEAKDAYEKSVINYEKELKYLNDIGKSIQSQMNLLDELAAVMKAEEEKLDRLNSDYTALVSIMGGNQEDKYLLDFNVKYSFLVDKYKTFTEKGVNAVYKNLLEYGMKWDTAENRRTVNEILNLMVNGGDDYISLEELENNVLKGEESKINLQIRLAAIELFNKSIQSSADWYSKVKENALIKNEKKEIFAEDLYNRLKEDYDNALELLKEKQLEYESKYKLKDSIELPAKEPEKIPIPSLEEYLAKYSDELAYCEGLLQLYTEFFSVCPFIQEEIWLDSYNLMTSLFENYGLNQTNSSLPGAQSISDAIKRKSGDFIYNASFFIIEFENCFSIIPQWLEHEISGWKDSLIEYFAAYALNNNVQPKKGAAVLFAEQEEISAKCIALYDIINSQDTIDDYYLAESNKTLINMIKDYNMLNYMYQITESFEEIYAVSQSKDEKHWREYLSYEHSINNISSFKKAASLEEGILADTLYYADYFTNRINDSFNIYKDKNINTDETAEYYYYLYSDEILKNIINLYSLNSLYNDFEDAARAYEYSKMSPDMAKAALSAHKVLIETQEGNYNHARNNYFAAADIFIGIGGDYDKQYVKLKLSHENTEQKRFEYEKQDAIQRWASTSYLDTDVIDLENTKNKLTRAKTVLNVLTDIFGGNNKHSSGDPAYEALYSAYEQSFSAKMKVLETVNSLSSVLLEEYKKNDLLYSQYQTSLNQLGSPDQSILNIITVKNGRLAFSADGSNSAALSDYFNGSYKNEEERYDVSLYELSLRGLNERMTKYFSNPDKYAQWSYARDYLLLSMINSNKNFEVLKNYYSGANVGKSSGDIGKLMIKIDTNVFVKNEFSIYERIKSSSGIDSYENTCFDNWKSLSEEERADLEFYVILTLANSNGYTGGFEKYMALQVTANAYAYAEHYCGYARRRKNDAVDYFFNRIQINKMIEMNNNTFNKIKPSYQKLQEIVNDWIIKLQQNLSLNQTNISKYKESCKKIALLNDNKEAGLYVTWDDIYSTLLSAGKMNNEAISDVEIYWETMLESSSGSYTSVNDALMNLLKWTQAKETENKNALEIYWLNTAVAQKDRENSFLTAVESYISGSININQLKTAANNAYKNKAVISKNHLDNMHTAMLNNLWMYENMNADFKTEFQTLGEEIITITEKIMKDRYNAELKAREAEWNQTLAGFKDKYKEWVKSAALIVENGRNAWEINRQKMKSAEKQWVANFLIEHNRVSDEWALAYLAGLQDKEIWLEQAANAYYQASSESLLSLIGAEGERLSRFIDTREPIGVSVDLSQANTLMEGLLKSSGIANMSGAFGSLNNTSAYSPLVKRGIGGALSWDAALVKTAASDLARKTNEEIANAETRKIAYNTRITAEEAVKKLTVSVQTANSKFTDSMDNAYIVNGLWGKSGNNYVKDVIKGSTLFDPIVSEKVTIAGYASFMMEPVTLKSNLDENYLANLNSIAINELLTNVFAEIEKITADIFGNSENSMGKFNEHIGQNPVTKPEDEMGRKRKDVFVNEGSGELGRLISELIYWSIVENYGLEELKTAAWDKRMWDDEGSWFKSPTLRSVGSIAGSIVAGIATGGALTFAGIALSAAINSASEIVFSSLDVMQGYKSIDTAAFNVGKTILTNTATSFSAGAFSGIDGAKGILGQGLSSAMTGGSAGTIMSQTITAGLQTFTTGLSTSLISGITYNSENGFSYSGEIVQAGIKGMLTNSLTSMTSALVSSSLTSINSSLDMSKLKGFSNINKSDLQKFNNLTGSLAGQGVNYAMGNDFTLNVLNLGILTDNKVNSGILELHLGRGGAAVNIGTGGANVSIDNLIHSIKGATVWNTNNNISRYIEDQSKEGGNGFDSNVTLRAQYGYGDTVQKSQLSDILKGRTLIDTSAEGDYIAKTDNENSNRVIHLANYQQGMSAEDQFLLATVFGHEAYRDGYKTGEFNASGNYVTKNASFNELKDASIARIIMADRINEENNWFYNVFEGLAYESVILDHAKTTRNFSEFEDYLTLAYNNTEDYQWISVNNNGNYQNIYKSVPLFNSELTDKRITEVNQQRLADAFEKYSSTFTTESQWQNADTIYNDFINNKKLQSDWGYRDVSQTSIAGYGCMFMSTKYGIEAITGGYVNTLALHGFIKNNNYLAKNTDNLLSKELMATIMTEYTNGQYKVEYVSAFGGSPSIDTLNLVETSQEKYLAHLRIQNPNVNNALIHSVMVSGIDHNKSETGQITGINTVHVANPLLPSNHFNTRTSYLPEEIVRWDFFKVIQNRL